MAAARAEDEVRTFIERTQIPFLRSPMGKGVMPDDHPLSVAAARTLALQNADVVFLMGARFNWILHFGQPPRYAKDVKVIQLDIAPEEIGHNKATEVALVGDGQAIAACVVHPDLPVIHLSGDSAIGFSGMEMETLVRYNFPAKIVVLNNGGIGPGMPEIPENPMFNMKPNALIYGARYDRVMEAFGGKGFFVEDPKDLRGALDEAMNFRGPALVNVVISQGSARKQQQFRWHS